MHLLAFFNSCTFVVYLFLGFYVLILDCNSRIHQLFFFMCISLSLGVFSVIPALQATSKYYVSLWVKIGWMGFIGFLPVFNHFYIYLTTKKKINKFILAIIYLPAFFLFYKNFNNGVLFKEFYRIHNKWEYVYNTEITGIYLLAVYASVTIICYIILIFHWRNKDKSIKTKRQSLILLMSALLTFLLLVSIVILPLFFNYSFFGYHTLIFLIWIIGIYIAIVKFRFMSFTPSAVSEEIISNIDEAIILLDNSLRIIVMNKKSEDIFNNNQEKYKGDYFSKIVLEHENVLNGINKLYLNEAINISYWVNFVNYDNFNTLMDIKISIVKDKFGDNIGFLLIGKEVKSIKHLKIMYKITDREVEVVQHIINGSTNKEIAQEIGVTLRTVKAHITNIYNKLGVNNKSHLLAFLNDFNLTF